MTMKLASAKSDGRPLDFGTITFTGGHMLVERGTYKGQWEFTEADVDISDVADDYAIPVPAPGPKPKSEYKVLTRGTDLIQVMVQALGLKRIDDLLVSSPSIQALIGQATKIERNAGNVPVAIARLKQLGLTDIELAAVDQQWAALK